MRLESNDYHVIHLDDGCEVIGVVFNMTWTNAILHIKGRNEVRKLLGSRYSDPARRFLLAAWSMITPVECIDGSIEIRCLPVDDLDGIETHELGTDVDRATNPILG